MTRLLKFCALLPFLLLAGCGSGSDRTDLKASDTQAVYKITKAVTISEVGCTIYEVEYKASPDAYSHYLTLSKCASGETSSRVNGNKGAYTDVHNITVDADVQKAKSQLDQALVQQKQAYEKFKAESEARAKLLERLTPEERRLLNIPQ